MLHRTQLMPLPNLNFQKKKMFLNSKTKTKSCAIQCSGESVMTHPWYKDVWERAQKRICENQDERKQKDPELYNDASVRMIVSKVLSTDKPRKRLWECVLLCLRLLKEHRQPWSVPWFSWGRFNMQAFSIMFSLEYLFST